MEDSKPAIRERLREHRRQLDPATVSRVGRRVMRSLLALDIVRHARSLVAYVEAENEVPASGPLRAAVCAGQGTFLPKGGRAVSVVPWRPGEPLTRGRGGISEPREDRCSPILRPAAVLVPLVAFDESGTRLGRGGGVYDRLLVELGLEPDIVRLGLAYEFQKVAELPRDAWDVALDYVITEDRIVRCGGAVGKQDGGFLA